MIEGVVKLCFSFQRGLMFEFEMKDLDLMHYLLGQRKHPLKVIE